MGRFRNTDFRFAFYRIQRQVVGIQIQGIHLFNTGNVEGQLLSNKVCPLTVNGVLGIGCAEGDQFHTERGLSFLKLQLFGKGL